MNKSKRRENKINKSNQLKEGEEEEEKRYLDNKLFLIKFINHINY